MDGKDHVDWSYYDKFDQINDKYLPMQGQGDTMATRICTVINKLVYKWYNDGDVFDNTYFLQGWCNDLSSYANWLYMYASESQEILDRIQNIKQEADYEFLLKDLTDRFLNEKKLSDYNAKEKIGDIYNCNGKFKFVDYSEENYEEDGDEEM